MKHIFFLFALIPFLAIAQVEPKYQAGAVPVENGKVVFSKEIQVPSKSRQEIYDVALKWANERFATEACRVVYQNPEQGEIAATGKEYIVFANNVLSLDRSMMSYQVMLYCKDQSCTVKLTNLRYEYNVSYQREPEKYIAEEWITDKYALRKNGKLNRITGKFRRKTIDFADELFASVSKAFGQKEEIVAEESTSVQSVPAAKLKPASQVPEGFTRMEAANVPSTLQQMMSDSDMRIKLVENNITEDAAVWKGLGSLFGKNIASVSVASDSRLCREVKEGERYTIQFSAKPFAGDQVWMIIECSKQGQTPDGEKQTVVGEILNIWVK